VKQRGLQRGSCVIGGDGELALRHLS
jgi:hypothetical protein